MDLKFNNAEIPTFSNFNKGNVRQMKPFHSLVSPTSQVFFIFAPTI